MEDSKYTKQMIIIDPNRIVNHNHPDFIQKEKESSLEEFKKGLNLYMVSSKSTSIYVGAKTFDEAEEKFKQEMKRKNHNFFDKVDIVKLIAESKDLTISGFII